MKAVTDPIDAMIDYTLDQLHQEAKRQLDAGLINRERYKDIMCRLVDLENLFKNEGTNTNTEHQGKAEPT